MFFRRSFFFVLFALLLVGGLFGPRQRGRYADGYAAGYASAAQAAQAAEGTADGAPAAPAPAPAAPVSTVHHGHWGFFGIIGFFFKVWLSLALFGFLMKMFFGRGRRHGWTHHRHWGRHRHGPGPRGPWGRNHGGWQPGAPEGDAPAKEKQPEDVEPDVRTL